MHLWRPFTVYLFLLPIPKPPLIQKACKLLALGNQAPSWRNLYFPPDFEIKILKAPNLYEVILIRSETKGGKGHSKFRRMKNPVFSPQILAKRNFSLPIR